MVKVVGPFFSVKASGSIGNALYVRCGTVMAKKRGNNIDKPEDEELNDQQLLFQEAAQVWKQLPDNVRKEWKAAFVKAWLKPGCVALYLGFLAAFSLGPYFSKPPPLGWTKTPWGMVFSSKYLFPVEYTQLLGMASMLAVPIVMYPIGGYQLWISTYLLTKGQPWPSYPYPPPAFLK